MKKFIATGVLFLLPLVTFAQVVNPQFSNSIITLIGNWISTFTPLVIGAAMLFFLYGLMKFVLNSGNEDAKDEGKRIMIWGIIALFVMVSVWGLVGLVNQETGINAGGGTAIPNVPAVPAP